MVRREAFERAQLTRAAVDEALGLTDEEFRLEGSLIAIGPIPGEDSLSELIERFEEAGLRYFDDFFELSGNWPEWLGVFAMERSAR
jgi:predicted RNA-binding protein with PUA domain